MIFFDNFIGVFAKHTGVLSIINSFMFDKSLIINYFVYLIRCKLIEFVIF